MISYNHSHTFWVSLYSIYIMKAMTIVVVLLGLFALSATQEPSSEDVQYLQMRRTACVILSRIHSNQEKDTIQEVVQGLDPNDQQRYINKLYAVAVEKCESEITQQEVQSVPLSSFSSTLKVNNLTLLLCSLFSMEWTTKMSSMILRPPKNKI